MTVAVVNVTLSGRLSKGGIPKTRILDHLGILPDPDFWHVKHGKEFVHVLPF